MLISLAESIDGLVVWVSIASRKGIRMSLKFRSVMVGFADADQRWDAAQICRRYKLSISSCLDNLTGPSPDETDPI